MSKTTASSMLAGPGPCRTRAQARSERADCECRMFAFASWIGLGWVESRLSGAALELQPVDYWRQLLHGPEPDPPEPDGCPDCSRYPAYIIKPLRKHQGGGELFKDCEQVRLGLICRTAPRGVAGGATCHAFPACSSRERFSVRRAGRCMKVRSSAFSLRGF